MFSEFADVTGPAIGHCHVSEGEERGGGESEKGGEDGNKGRTRERAGLGKSWIGVRAKRGEERGGGVEEVGVEFATVCFGPFF